MPASYVTGQSSYSTTDISYSWVVIYFIVYNVGNPAFWINAANHMCCAHMTDDQAKVLKNCKKCRVKYLNAQDIAK